MGRAARADEVHRPQTGHAVAGTLLHTGVVLAQTTVKTHTYEVWLFGVMSWVRT